MPHINKVNNMTLLKRLFRNRKTEIFNKIDEICNTIEIGDLERFKLAISNAIEDENFLRAIT